MPRRWIDYWRGTEDFNYPYTSRLADNSSWHPDVIHAHNLHGDYFDLTALVSLSQKVPVVWTLHDPWALAGHCGYFIDCERWQTGCGNCPDLNRSPAVRRDRTAENWQRKRQIYDQSRLAVATPSRWLMSCVEQSILRPWQRRVIPNGVDLEVHKPGRRQQAREALGLPPSAFILLAVSAVATGNPYKDFTTINQVVRLVAAQTPTTDLVYVCMGESNQSASESWFRYTGYLSDPYQVALYYQAADVLLHAANAENFPCVVLESLACGTPVIATAVGGIPEQIVDGETGFLVPRGDSHAMAQHVLELINQPERCRAMGQVASAWVQRNYRLEQQVATYLEWFDELREEYCKMSMDTRAAQG
jgi:glycosyltransferase involved in cell wall biosynthesis